MTSPDETTDLPVPPLAQMHKKRSAKWAAYPPDVLSVALAEMDYALAPPVAEAVDAALRRSDLGYVLGTPTALVQAFCGFTARRMRWSVDPSGVQLVPDVMTAVRAIAAQILTPGERVVVPDLVYGPIPRDLRQLGLIPVPVGLRDDDGLQLASLQAELQRGARMVVLVNPSNPLGESFRRQDLARIAELCSEFDAWVISDEIHAPLTLPDAVHASWLTCSPCARERGFVLTGASKAFNFAALKAAVVVADGFLARRVLDSLQSLAESASVIGVVASQAAFDEGDEWLNAVLAQLGRNRLTLKHAVAKLLPEISWTPPEATYFAWLDCSRFEWTRSPAAVFLERGRLALSPGEQFGVSGRNHVRLNFATSDAHLQAAIRRMARVVAELAPYAD